MLFVNRLPAKMHCQRPIPCLSFLPIVKVPHKPVLAVRQSPLLFRMQRLPEAKQSPSLRFFAGWQAPFFYGEYGVLCPSWSLWKGGEDRTADTRRFLPCPSEGLCDSVLLLTGDRRSPTAQKNQAFLTDQALGYIVVFQSLLPPTYQLPLYK